MVDFMPPYGGGFDALGVASQYGHVHSKDHYFGSGFVALSDDSPNKKTVPSYVPAVCGAFSLLQVPPIVRPASMVRSDLPSYHMDIHQAPVPTAFVAISPSPVTRRFVRASRGRRLVTSIMGSTADLNRPTEASAVNSMSDVDILGECPLRPPPQV
jgi:hypothetical protein